MESHIDCPFRLRLHDLVLKHMNELTMSMGQRLSCEANSRSASQKFSVSYESEGSLLCSQGHAKGPYLKPD
jgi:hypothetical protein